MFARRVDFGTAAQVVARLSHCRGLVWLDSNQVQTNDGRYSFVSAEPSRTVQVPFGEHPLATLSRLDKASDRSEPTPIDAKNVPLWIGYIAYDATWTANTRKSPRHARAGDPVVWFGRYDAVFAFDHASNQTFVVGDDAAACDRLEQRLDPGEGQSQPASRGLVDVDDAQLHRVAIARALEHITAGDIYQVNLARRWSARFEGAPITLWHAMRAASEVPLGAFIDAGDHAVLACTMERFLRWDRTTGRLTTKPIKGTLARAPDDSDETPRLLRGDPKEQAEHVMIVDLMRNDLGRVAKTGTVKVEAPLVVEPFTDLYHLVSTIACETRGDVTFADVVQATFPPGSVTGAPKIRAIEIIEELETHPRQVYCGAVGFVDRQGGCSLAVAIRTALVHDGRVHYWAGGGLVEASDPDREVAETELKAQVFLKALETLDR